MESIERGKVFIGAQRRKFYQKIYSMEPIEPTNLVVGLASDVHSSDHLKVDDENAFVKPVERNVKKDTVKEIHESEKIRKMVWLYNRDQERNRDSYNAVNQAIRE